ncbi:hypothetical protein COOONC_14471 [Cooperia oncophora]
MDIILTILRVSEYLQLETGVTKKGGLFYFVVKRMSTGTELFNTSVGGLIFSDKFIQVVTKLPSQNMYGLGEHVHPNLKHEFSSYRTWPMYARDEFPNARNLDTKNLYGNDLCCNISTRLF